jgi:predicted histone-like DNA-binding protein
MPVLLNKVSRINPMNKTAPKKWYITLKTIKQLKESEVARQISDETTLNRKEAELALSQFEKVLVNALLSSQSVQLGDFGSFHLTCNSAGADSKETLTAGAVKNLNIRFQPGSALKEALTKASFVFAEDLVSK